MLIYGTVIKFEKNGTEIDIKNISKRYLHHAKKCGLSKSFAKVIKDELDRRKKLNK